MPELAADAQPFLPSSSGSGLSCAAELRDAVEVVHQELAVVGHVEGLHLERADAVRRREGGVLHPLHRELVGRVRHVLGLGVEDGVVVAAAQLELHLAGDARRDPAREGVLQEHRLGIEPLALVEHAAEPATEREVEIERVLVVHRARAGARS